MRLSHARRAISARFDDPNLVSCAGLVPVMALADRCGLTTLLLQHVKITAKGGANAAVKILAIVAGMVCGADSIDDLDLLRHGGMPRLFTAVRAPSTVGTFLRLCDLGQPSVWAVGAEKRATESDQPVSRRSTSISLSLAGPA